MKKLSLRLSPLVLLALLFINFTPTAQAQTETATPSETLQPTQNSYGRPLIIIETYSLDAETVKFGADVNLTVKIYNSGQHYAYNVVLTFLAGDLIPRGTGGVLAVGEIAPGNRASLLQPLTASTDLWGKALASLDLNISYSAVDGTIFTEKFSLTFPITPPNYVIYTPTPTPTATPSPTPTAVLRPQLVIVKYTTDMTPLEPGTQFNLKLEVQNMGNGAAKRVTMIVGGGATSSVGGTPDAGGISGGGGEFTNFAPLGSSNVQFLGELAIGDTLQASQSLIVNVATNPGAYPMKISFVYLDERGVTITDEQVITLLVYRIPKMDISFYQDPGMFITGQSGSLPLQIVNLGRNSAVLGNMKVTANGAQLMNNTLLVGALDMGGYLTLDATIIPDVPGPLELTITVDYTDDFNQPQTIVKTLTIEVAEAPIIEPPPDGGVPGDSGSEPVLPVTETFWQKLLRFILGLLGLDSNPPTAGPGGVIIPGESLPSKESKPIPAPLKGP